MQGCSISYVRKSKVLKIYADKIRVGIKATHFICHSLKDITLANTPLPDKNFYNTLPYIWPDAVHI